MINSPAGLRQFFSSVDCIFIYCFTVTPEAGLIHIINIRKLPKWVIEDQPISSNLSADVKSFQYIQSIYFG